jgi:hypothetical protein
MSMIATSRSGNIIQPRRKKLKPYSVAVDIRSCPTIVVLSIASKAGR